GQLESSTRLARPAADDVRVCDQPQDGKGDWTRDPRSALDPRRQSDRMKRCLVLLHLLTAAIGTKRTSRDFRYLSAFGAKRTGAAASPRSSLPLLTQLRHRDRIWL